MHQAVLAFLADLRRRRPERRVVGLGIATPGFIDPVTGTVVTIGRVPNWNNLPLAGRLREATGLHVTIGNDMDALASAEFGLGEEARTYAYVGYAEGVKFTMFLDGAPYAGPFGNAGLVGPELLAGGGDASDAELLRMHGLVASYEREAAGTPGPESVQGPSSQRPPSPRTPAQVRRRLDEILLRAAQGEQPAERVITRMLGVLGDQVAAFVHLLQPELLVIGGGLAGAPAALLDRLETNVRRRLPTLLDNALIVRRAHVVAAEATAVGATRVFLRRFLAEETVPLADVGAVVPHGGQGVAAGALGTVGHDRTS
ncbi:MAG: ROK family protein [Trueperaceae bacterium]|nr:ROK family protein [Trueperaceae bacterium]